MEEKELLEKIENGEELTEGELSDLVWDYEFERKDIDKGRWVTYVKTIVKLCDRYFAIEWEEGLTELQENGFFEQPYEVKKVECEKVVKVTEWVGIEKGENE